MTLEINTCMQGNYKDCTLQNYVWWCFQVLEIPVIKQPVQVTGPSSEKSDVIFSIFRRPALDKCHYISGLKTREDWMRMRWLQLLIARLILCKYLLERFSKRIASSPEINTLLHADSKTLFCGWISQIKSVRSDCRFLVEHQINIRQNLIFSKIWIKKLDSS